MADTTETEVIDAAPAVDIEMKPKSSLLKTLSKPYLNRDDKVIHLCIYACELINHSGVMLHCPQLVIAAAQRYLQRFYRKQENREKYPPFFVAMTCIYLATKVQEEKRRHRDVLTVFDRLLKKRTTKGPRRDFKPIDPMSKRYVSWKMSMMRLELVLLKTLGYRFQVSTPHSYLLQYIQFLELDNSVTEPSWVCANDSLRIPMLVDIPSNIIACACLYKGAKKTTVTLPTDWNYPLDVSMDDIEYVADIIEEIFKFSKTKNLNYTEPDPDLPNEHIEAIKYPAIPNQKKPDGKDPSIPAKSSKKEKDVDKKEEKKEKSERSRKKKRSDSRDRGRKRRRHSSSRSGTPRSRSRRDRKRKKKRSERRH